MQHLYIIDLAQLHRELVLLQNLLKSNSLNRCNIYELDIFSAQETLKLLLSKP